MPSKPPDSTPRPSQWELVGPVERFQPGQLTTFKKDYRQLVIGRRADGALFALDNRCPHEGYPLAQGDLKDCSLTCAWHNWKFDVRDGRCTLGGEDVRAYPIRVRANHLEVDVTDPPLSALLPSLRQSLERALFNNDVAWALRDAARMLHAGYAPWNLLADVARYDALHAEYGTTHTLAVATDCGRLLDRYPGVDALYPIAVTVDLCAETNVRLPPRALPPPHPGGSAEAIRRAVEAEEAATAEALLRGAFQSGSSAHEVQCWLYRIMADHFLDFGHSLIYLVKAGELLGHVDASYAPDVYAALLYGAALATREDRLPYLRGYFRAFPDDDAELASVAKRAHAHADFDFIATRDAVLDGTARDAARCVWSALERGVSGRRVARALVAAAAHRLLRFDPSWDSDPDVAENWLWATHRLTFASAVRQTLERFESPVALRYLLQAAAFIHSGHRMDTPAHERVEFSLSATEGDSDTHASEVVAAIRERRADLAVRAAAASLAAGGAASLRHALHDACVHDPAVRPIFVAHALKTTMAAFEEYEALQGDPDHAVPVLAVVRFLASPLVERRVAATVRGSLRRVVDGVMPRKLTQ